MKEFCLDVYLTQKSRWRASFSANKKPGKKEMLEILKSEEYDDITDEETIEIVSVDSIDA